MLIDEEKHNYEVDFQNAYYTQHQMGEPMSVELANRIVFHIDSGVSMGIGQCVTGIIPSFVSSFYVLHLICIPKFEYKKNCSWYDSHLCNVLTPAVQTHGRSMDMLRSDRQTQRGSERENVRNKNGISRIHQVVYLSVAIIGSRH